MKILDACEHLLRAYCARKSWTKLSATRASCLGAKKTSP
jgi:hypothetical protein